ncbi:MAG: methionyl-tRNA formyltransferase [Candidatus Brocadia sp. WS118]|nr:MAG: methionyl-tRNA formyltransferase [Candidatus Brocadia sp. WS118]
MRYILLTEKTWHDKLFDHLLNRKEEDWFRITQKENFNLSELNKTNPEKIFIPHWSHIIPAEIYERYECIVFHMTDLPYGRGGSPLQNLIVRGHQETKISAIRINQGIDTGKIYLKAPLSLLGTAEEIFLRSSEVIQRMIAKIIETNPEPQEQKGDVVNFKRRKAEEGDISKLESLEQAYDYIRMLDCNGYPSAFLETETFRFEFSRASLKADQSIIADVRITKK